MACGLTSKMYMGCGQQTKTNQSIDGENLNIATEFKYLGSVMSSDENIMVDVQSTVNAAWLKW